MEVKRLFAVNMKEALARVREEMGDEAMIVDTQKVPGGVEVTASLDLPEPLGLRRDTTARVEASVAQSITQVRDRLLASGFDAQHLESWLPLFDGSDWVSSLARRLPVAARPTAPERGRWAFVGAAGTGKTTMVSNLVANHALRYGPDNAALISLDTWRAGGAEQLKIIARLLNVPVFVARDVGDVARMLKVVESRTLVVVDTPGFAMTEQGVAQGRRLLEPLAQLMPLVLTVPATLASALQHRLLGEFASLVDGLTITHVDEAIALGEALDVARAHSKFVWWLGCGPGIPDDLESADGDLLARRLLGVSAIAAQVPMQAKCTQETSQRAQTDNVHVISSDAGSTWAAT